MSQEQAEHGPGDSYSSSEIERLGRERPEAFKSAWVEVGFCFSLLGSMFVAEYFISGFNVLLPSVTNTLHIPPQAATWPASVFSLVAGAFLLPFGRLSDLFGGKAVFVGGLVWFLIWSLIGGFSQNYIMLIFCRALQGFGPAAYLVSGIMLLSNMYRPGPRKNFVFSLYGAFAPVGFFVGIFFAGICAQFLSWKWYFYFGSIMLALVTVVSVFTIPSDGDSRVKGVKMDWYGTVTVVSALLLIVFALTEGSHAPKGWATPYIIVTFVLGWILFGAFVYIEGWIAEQPLLPRSIFAVPGLKPMALALFFQYGVFGIFIFYASFYIEDILNASPILTAAYFTPMCVGGLILATVGGLVLHLLPGRILLIISGTCYTLCVLLFAIIPVNPNYWAYVFPAMLCATAGIDITYNITNIFITTSLPKALQGVAGALINSILFLGISFFLGLADLAVSQTADRGKRESYKVAFWFGTGCAIFGVIVMTLGVKIGKAESGLTADEKAELERELTETRTNE